MNYLDKIKESLADVNIGSLTILPVLSAILIFLVCIIAIKLIMKVIDRVLENSRIENVLKSFVRSGVKVLLWAVTIILIAGELKIQTAPFVALLSVIGLAFSLSIQGVMSNLFSGITILLTKPFSSGDYIEMDSVSGSVTEVGLFYTHMNTVDNKVIYVPNSQVTGSKVINYTRQDTRRIEITISASYDDETENVKAALLDTVREDGRALSEPAPFVGLTNFGDSAIEYVLRVWVPSVDYWDIYFSLNEGIRESFNKRGITMTYPHLIAHIEKE